MGHQCLVYLPCTLHLMEVTPLDLEYCHCHLFACADSPPNKGGTAITQGIEGM